MPEMSKAEMNSGMEPTPAEAAGAEFGAYDDSNSAPGYFSQAVDGDQRLVLYIKGDVSAESQSLIENLRARFGVDIDVVEPAFDRS